MGTLENENSTENQPPTAENAEMDPMMKLLLDIKKSNENSAKDIRTEIGGLSNVINTNNMELNSKINGLQQTINSNAEEFRKEIVQIDKKFNENERKTINLIDKAIGEALKTNNSRWEARMNKLEEK